MSIIGPSWPFFLDPNLAQLLTLTWPSYWLWKWSFFSIFCFLKSAEIPMFIVLLNFNQNLPKNGPQKNDNFSHFAKHRFMIKKPFCCNPPFDQNWCYSTCVFETKNNDVEQKHNLKSAKNKDKKNGFQREKKTGNQKRENIDEGKLCSWIFWCCSFHETKAKKKEKERKRQNKEAKESKKERQERKEKRTRRERQKKRNWKRGSPKKAKEKQRETHETKNALF